MLIHYLIILTVVISDQFLLRLNTLSNLSIDSAHICLVLTLDGKINGRLLSFDNSYSINILFDLLFELKIAQNQKFLVQLFDLFVDQNEKSFSQKCYLLKLVFLQTLLDVLSFYQTLRLRLKVLCTHSFPSLDLGYLVRAFFLAYTKE